MKDFKQRNILLNPGPACISSRVKKAQIIPDICPREREFGDVMERVSKGLLGFVKNTNNASCVLFGGSGTLAVEAALSSLVSSKHKLAIINNGAYGERMCEIARLHDLNFIEFRSDVLELIDYDGLLEFLQKERPDFLALVHSETTSGLINDLKIISKLAKPLGIKIIADCMSSYACYELDLKEVDVIIASSNKNIQGMAGVSFVIANDDLLEGAKYAKSLYLDLASQYNYFKKNHQMRFTPPVQTIYALDEAIRELEEEGLENRYKRYEESNQVLREGLLSLGFEVYPKNGAGVIISAVMLKDGMDFDKLHDYCKDRGFTIYPGKIAGLDMFRIANIGAIDSWDMRLFLEILKEFERDFKS